MLPSDENNKAGIVFPDAVDLKQLVYDNQERLKELAAINDTTAIIKAGKPIPETEFSYTLGSFNRDLLKGYGKTTQQGVFRLNCQTPGKA